MRRWKLALGALIAGIVVMLSGTVGGAVARPSPAEREVAVPGADAMGQLCVVKFNDLNGDGRRALEEPELTGWVFTVTNDDFVTVGVLGTAPGVNRCIDLGGGTFTVTETAQPGWAATTPGGAAQTVTVVAGETAIVTFGNRFSGGRLCVGAFNDRNRNGKREDAEPWLYYRPADPWEFTVTELPSDAVVTRLHAQESGPVTSCFDVPPGTYRINESMAKNWLPTMPGGTIQTVTVTAGRTTTATFGNFYCCLTITYQSGKDDGFKVSDGRRTEPATPIAIPCPGPPCYTSQSYFDSTSVDTPLTHRLKVGSGSCIWSAVLSMKAKALGKDAQNDTITLRAGGSVWKKTVRLSHPARGPEWTTGSTKTVQLRLDPVFPDGLSALLPALNNTRVLDVTVEDDTSVDYIRLDVVFCPC